MTGPLFTPSASRPASLSGLAPVVVPPSVDEAFAVLQEALRQLPAQAAPGLAILGALKGAWSAARTHAKAVNLARGGRAAGETLAGAADRLLRLLLDFAGKRAGARASTPGIALLALGSYGRRELAPFSDLDLLILHAPSGSGPGAHSEGRLETLVGALLRPLWDAGMHLGHAVRTPGECLAAMEDDAAQDSALETATALLEARYVAGDTALANLFLKKDLEDFFKRRGKRFLEAKLEEAIGRHHRQGASVYRTQPNLKDSPGAMRDYQLSTWIDRASQLSGHLPRLAKRPLVSPEAIAEAAAGYECMLTYRAALHGACGRKQDVLDYAMQQTLSEDLGLTGTEELRGSERLLRDYFRAARAIYRLADLVILRYREEQAVASRDIERLRRRPVDPDFTRVGDFLYAAHTDLFAGEGWLELSMRAFLHASRLGVGLSQEVGAAIRAQLPRLNEEARRRPHAAQLFLELLQRRSNVAGALRAMREVGLLGEYLPEFAEVQGLVIHDVFHDFTVDEHTLFVVEYIDRLFASPEPADRLRRAVLERQPRPELLRMAALFHDLGKSRGGAGHSQRGALMVPQIAERLGLAQAETKTLIFLVEQHLLLSRTSTRRELGEGQLLEELAAQIGSRERLDLLYLLTCADSSAVGQGSFPHWKDELLGELYRRIDARLAPERRAAASSGTQPAEDESRGLEAQLAATARNDEERRLIHEHCVRVPPRYLVEVGVEEARLHLDLCQELCAKNREAVAAVRGTGGLVDVWAASTDRPRRFAQIAGAFLGSGVNVVSAIAYTRADGLILDHFRVSLDPAAGTATPQAGAAFWTRVAAGIEAALAGGGGSDFRAQIEAVRRRIPRAPLISRRVEPEVRIDNKLSARYTVVDVVCGDRIGLLYGLSRALADLGCDIHFAKVDTIQGLATDVFYITDAGGGQVLDTEKAHNLRLLLKAVADDFQAAKR